MQRTLRCFQPWPKASYKWRPERTAGPLGGSLPGFFNMAIRSSLTVIECLYGVPRPSLSRCSLTLVSTDATTTSAAFGLQPLAKYLLYVPLSSLPPTMKDYNPKIIPLSRSSKASLHSSKTLSHGVSVNNSQFCELLVGCLIAPPVSRQTKLADVARPLQKRSSQSTPFLRQIYPIIH